MSVIIFIVLTLISTFLGGLLAFKYRDQLHIVLGFTAGILLSVVAFDLLPEIMEMTQELGVDPIVPMVALIAGFFIFHVLEKTLLIHHAHEDQYGPHTHPTVGIASALALAAHSFLDGVGIGLGFQVSPALGMLVSLGVISHAFSDGLNTVTLMLQHQNPAKKTMWFLVIVAFAPVLGGLSTLFFTVSQNILLLYLGFFAGFFLYIGASEVLPEAHSQRPSGRAVLATITGVIFMFVATSLAR
jgi:ZIP family zinc transporter